VKRRDVAYIILTTAREWTTRAKIVKNLPNKKDVDFFIGALIKMGFLERQGNKFRTTEKGEQFIRAYEIVKSNEHVVEKLENNITSYLGRNWRELVIDASNRTEPP
jgi:predicted transcriptional regulator